MVLTLFNDMNVFYYVQNEHPCLFKVKVYLYTISEVQPNFILNLVKITYPLSNFYLNRMTQNYARGKRIDVSQ